MTEAITTATALTPIGAVLVLAALAQVGIVQLAKQQDWSKTRTQRVSVAVATVLGAAAALVLGLIAGVPDSVVQAVSAVLLSVAAVAVLGQALYKVLGYAIPDGTETGQLLEHGRRADRDGVPDGRDTPPDATA